jgi:hypothetical protein
VLLAPQPSNGESVSLLRHQPSAHLLLAVAGQRGSEVSVGETTHRLSALHSLSLAARGCEERHHMLSSSTRGPQTPGEVLC